MIIDVGHYTRILKNILYFLILSLVVYFILKTFLFFSPFLIGLIIANCLEPLIKKMMYKCNISRRASTIISMLMIFIIIGAIVAVASVTIISEASKLLNNMNIYMPIISDSINNIINSVDINKLNVSVQIKELIQSSTNDILLSGSNYVSNVLNSILNLITKIPEICIYIIITFLATYFICVDRFYIKDQFEHHIPRLWIKRFNNHFKEITIQLLNYIKAEMILVVISFIVVLIGLYILDFMKFNIGFPLITAIGIGIVDALPILGSGTVLVPWAVVVALMGDIKLAIALVIIYIVVLLERQLLEPRIVSGKIGIHPIFTLCAMYAGFKIMGILGLIIGPIILIIYKNIFESLIERGIVKTIFEKNS